MITDANLAATFSSERSLSVLEIAEIAQRTDHSVHFVGRMGAHQNWHYRLYARKIEPLTEEGLMYIVDKGLRIVSSNQRYDPLIAKLFPNRRRSHDLAKEFARIQNP
ncbi:MAG: hypothetical protein AAB922_05155 [Patescibacteria group bacterium]